MSIIKRLNEMNAKFEQQIDDLLDKAKQHPDYEQAILSTNFKQGDRLMRTILSELTDNNKLISALLWRLK